MGGEPPPGYSSGGMRTKLVGGADRHPGRLRDGDRLRPCRPPAARAGGRARAAPGSCRAGGPLRPQALDRRRAGAARHAWWSTPARRARWRPDVRCCRPACAPSRARSSAAIRWWCAGLDGEALARGLSAYASADAARIAGHRSDEIEAILGWRGRDEIIHRDDLVLALSVMAAAGLTPEEIVGDAHRDARRPSICNAPRPPRARRRTCWPAHRTRERNAALACDGASLASRGHSKSFAANAADLAACTGTVCVPRPPGADRSARRGDGPGAGGRRLPARSARPHARRLDAAERAAHPAHRRRRSA